MIYYIAWYHRAGSQILTRGIIVLVLKHVMLGELGWIHVLFQ
jgi:hypothetical protein